MKDGWMDGCVERGMHDISRMQGGSIDHFV